MTYKSIVDTAEHIALQYHGGDRNKHDGELYLLHVHRVVLLARDAAVTGSLGQFYDYDFWNPANAIEIIMAIAWLHDTVEDTPLTLIELRSQMLIDGCNPTLVEAVVDGVDGMTKRNGESNEDYYQRCKRNPFSRFVKLKADMVDNFRRNHRITDPNTRARMARKYSLGVDILS